MISQAMAPPIPRWISRHWLGVVIAIAVVIGSSLGYLVGENRLSEERTKALSESDMYIGVLTKARADRDGRAALDKKITGAADRTLGPSLELVDSEVRRRLNRVCEELGFSEFSVTTGTSVARGTPAKKEFKRPEERKFRDEPDFVEVQASITASGRADQVFRLLFRVDAEPWTKRIESMRLDPTADGGAVRLSIRLTTIFLPGRAPKSVLVVDPAVLASANRFDQLFDQLFASNPFRIPPPPPPTTVVAVLPGTASTVDVGAGAELPVIAPSGAFPYGEWMLTAVVEGPSGPEAWLRHVPSGAALTLVPGTPVGELVLRAVEYDFAVFDAPGGSCRVQIGNNLTQRAQGTQ